MREREGCESSREETVTAGSEIKTKTGLLWGGVTADQEMRKICAVSEQKQGRSSWLGVE